MKDETPRGKLQGLRIATTREHPGVLDDLLRAEGASVRHIPLIRIAPPEDASALTTALTRLAEYRWVVLTSRNALRALLAHGVLPHPAPAFACVGEATAREAEAAGLHISLLPQRRHVKGLIEAFAALKQQAGRVLYPRSGLAPPTLKEGLQALGFTVDDPVAYLTLPDEPGMDQWKQAITELDAAVFASPSAVDNAWQAVGAAMSHARFYSIGPSTSARMREHGLKVAGEASVHSAESLAEAIMRGETHG